MYNTENNAESDFQNKRAYTPTDRWMCTLIKSDMLFTLKYDFFLLFHSNFTITVLKSNCNKQLLTHKIFLKI
jgi:hypothetical protein